MALLPSIVLYLLGLAGSILATSPDPLQIDIHGGVKMGEVDDNCDNATWRLDLDWPNTGNFETTCHLGYESRRPKSKIGPQIECIPKGHIPLPLHICMTHAICYTDQPPRAGPHRPLWPVYGEYHYVPPQRWIHSLEHGAAVFLYHPCADPTQIQLLKSLAKGCLRKHVITPYRNLPINQSYAVVTYGCRLMMGEVDPEAVINYVKEHALQGRETISRDGQYDHALIHKADLVSDIEDSGPLCPMPSLFDKLLKKDNPKTTMLDKLKKLLVSIINI